MKILQDYSISELKQQLSDLQLPNFRFEQIYLWSVNYVDFDEMSNLPESLRESLKKEFISLPVKIKNSYESKDGTIKFLYELSDGELIEGVLMQYKYGYTLCVSTQVGCRMGCSFCASGLDGLFRNLSAGEILGQVLCVNKFLGGTKTERKITNIVLMGSGEPLDNFDNVVKFIKLVSSKENLNISRRNISISTCGLADKIYKLTDQNLGITLTISLHATTDEQRKKIMKVANAYTLEELMASIRYYFEKTKRRVIFEYVMLEDNTSVQDAIRLKSLTRGIACHVNLIPLNANKECKNKGISKEKQSKFWQALKNEGISATTRRTLGSDIEGACGQLKRRVIKENL